jgi:hypothetical protein
MLPQKIGGLALQNAREIYRAAHAGQNLYFCLALSLGDNTGRMYCTNVVMIRNGLYAA